MVTKKVRQPLCKKLRENVSTETNLVANNKYYVRMHGEVAYAMLRMMKMEAKKVYKFARRFQAARGWLHQNSLSSPRSTSFIGKDVRCEEERS